MQDFSLAFTRKFTTQFGSGINSLNYHIIPRDHFGGFWQNSIKKNELLIRVVIDRIRKNRIRIQPARKDYIRFKT